MTFKKIFSNFLGMVKLEDSSYKNATKIGFGGALLAFLMIALATALGYFWQAFNFMVLIRWLVGLFIALVVTTFISTAIVHLLAKLFKGNGDYMEYYVGTSQIGLWQILNIIPVVGSILAGIGSLWGIVMTVKLIMSNYALSTGRAVGVFLLTVVVVLILWLILTAIFGAVFFAAFGGTAALSV